MAACAAWMSALAVLLTARPGLALDLERVLRDVARANPALEAEARRVEAAIYRVGQAGAWKSPMLEIGAMNVPTRGGFDRTPMTMKTIGITQSIPVFGHRGLERDAARAWAQASSARSERAHFDLYAEAWDVYAEAYYARALVHEVVHHRSVMDRLVRAARARYESGSGRLDDVLRAEAGRARTLSDQAEHEAHEAAARAYLAALRGLESPVASDTLAPLPVIDDLGADDRWIAAVDSLHPGLRVHDEQAAGYRLAARAARRSTWPELRFSASYGFRERLDTGVDQDDLVSAMVGFELPIFAGSTQHARAAELDAEAGSAESRRRTEVLRLHREVRSVHAAAVAARRMVGLLADTVVATQRRAMDASWSAYSAGSIDLWRVFEAAHALHIEEVELLRTRLALAKAHARLLALTTRADLLGIRLPEVQRSTP